MKTMESQTAKTQHKRTELDMDDFHNNRLMETKILRCEICNSQDAELYSSK